MENKADVQVIESFRASLAARPPLSNNNLTNYMASIDHAFRQDDIDQSELMGESMALQDNQSQDFYGKVIDQHGRPVIGADVTVQVIWELVGAAHKSPNRCGRTVSMHRFKRPVFDHNAGGKWVSN